MSTLKADTIQNTAGGAIAFTQQEALKFWVNHDGTDNSIRGSLNQSSIIDDSTGLFDYSYVTNFANVNYCRHGFVTQASGGSSSAAGCSGRKADAQQTNQNAMVYFENNANTFLDVSFAYAAANGDLA